MPAPRSAGFNVRATGKAAIMAVLLVDDRDGRVVDVFDNWRAALDASDRLEQAAPTLAGRFSLVDFSEHDGALLGASSSVTVRSLT